jgi:hypothetical protein
MSDAEELIELAKEKFKDFGEADEKLFNAVAAGGVNEIAAALLRLLNRLRFYFSAWAQ